MKKTILYLITFILFSGIFYYIQLPDYKEMSSNSFSTPLMKETTLNVIVYQYWQMDKLVHEIQKEHNKINGTPTTLIIRLYYSKWHILHGKEPFKIITFKHKIL